jgi:PAS domain S-box-containing protein
MNLDNLLLRLQALRERVGEMQAERSEALTQTYLPELTVTAIAEVSTALRELQSELRGVSDRWQLATSTLNSIIYDWDIARRTIDRTQGLFDVLGYRPEEVLPTPDWWTSCIHPDDKERVRNEVRHALATQTEFAAEYRILNKNGSYQYVWDRGLIVRNASGKAVRVVGSTLDITERKLAEAARHKSERRFRAIFNNTFQLMGLLTPEGIFLEANQATLDFIGSEADTVIGQPFWEMSCWNFSATIQAQLQAAITRAATGEFVRYEVELPGADGSLHAFDFSLKPIKDETGQVVLLVPEGRDITEIKQAQAALKESEARFQAILDKSPVSIYLKDLQGRYLLINPEAKGVRASAESR